MAEQEKVEIDRAEVEIQERTFYIYKPFISCMNCQRNMNPEQRQYGRIVKNYCQFKKQDLPLPKNNRDLDELKTWNEEHCKRAQACPMWLPSLIHPAAELTAECVGTEQPVEESILVTNSQLANGLKAMFSSGQV